MHYVQGNLWRIFEESLTGPRFHAVRLVKEIQPDKSIVAMQCASPKAIVANSECALEWLASPLRTALAEGFKHLDYRQDYRAERIRQNPHRAQAFANANAGYQCLKNLYFEHGLPIVYHAESIVNGSIT